jgi:hypothetical protein
MANYQDLAWQNDVPDIVPLHRRLGMTNYDYDRLRTQLRFGDISTCTLPSRTILLAGQEVFREALIDQEKLVKRALQLGVKELGDA